MAWVGCWGPWMDRQVGGDNALNGAPAIVEGSWGRRNPKIAWDGLGVGVHRWTDR